MPLAPNSIPAAHDGGEIHFTMTDGRKTVDCFVHPFPIDDVSRVAPVSPARRMTVFNEHREEVEAIAIDLFDYGEKRPYVASAWVQRYLHFTSIGGPLSGLS